MRTTVNIADDLLAKAKQFSGESENPELIRRAVKFIIAREKAIRHAERTGNRQDMRDTMRKLYDNEVDK